MTTECNAREFDFQGLGNPSDRPSGALPHRRLPTLVVRPWFDARPMVARTVQKARNAGYSPTACASSSAGFSADSPVI